jgi:hypothetical protein
VHVDGERRSSVADERKAELLRGDGVHNSKAGTVGRDVKPWRRG